MESSSMTDRETIIDMIKRASKQKKLFKNGSMYKLNVDKNSITVESGYLGFSTTFSFDDNGDLVSIGAYEG